MTYLQIGRRCSLLLSLLAASCGSEAGTTLVDIHVNRAACKASCTVDRFDLFVLRGSCVYAWRTDLGGKEQTLSQLELEPGAEVSIQLRGRCVGDSCTRCEAQKTFTPGAQTRVDLSLGPVSACSPSKKVAAACTSCLPGPNAYCDGARRVTCPASGQPKLETCPDGCEDGACKGCTKKAYYQDKDGDGYGDDGAKTVQCLAPKNSAQRGGDCNDANDKVHPGQQSYFTEPVSGGASFDYNCDNKDERQYPSPQSCSLNAGTCSGDGWMVLAPACGKSGFFASCYKNGPSCDWNVPTTKTQACR
jgi:hypothetical protein